MSPSKGTGRDGISRRAVRLLFLSNPMAVHEIISKRYMNPENKWLHISKIF